MEEERSTILPGLTRSELMSHGTERPTRMSNTFEPNELDTAMSPKPTRTTAHVAE